MARKFKIGDTVQVIKNVGGKEGLLDNSFKTGHRGTVTEYCNNVPYPYEVKRKNGICQWFKPQELKLIKRGTK